MTEDIFDMSNVRIFEDIKKKWGMFILYVFGRLSKGAKIRNRYNQIPHLTQDTNEKVTNSQLDTTNDSQEVSSFPAGDHKVWLKEPMLLQNICSCASSVRIAESW